MLWVTITTENKEAVPCFSWDMVHILLFGEAVVTAAVPCWEYDGPRTDAPNNQRDQAHQGQLRLLKEPQQ